MADMTGFVYLAAVGSRVIGGKHVRLHRVIVGTGTATSVVTIYNGDATTDPIVAKINAAAPGSYDFGGVALSDGMFIDMTVANSQVTVVYS